ncbi:MAG: DNA polymerase [Bacteroidota bacterium]|nr:DNA polymerase [Bacteroidota bacterium]
MTKYYQVKKFNTVTNGYDLVSIGLSMPQVVNYFHSENAKRRQLGLPLITGFSLATLNRRLSGVNNDRYTVESLQNQYKYLIIRITANVAERGITVGRKLANNVARKTTVTYLHTTHKLETHVFRVPYALMYSNRHKFTKYILDEIKKHGSDNIKQRFYQVRFKLDNDVWTGTPLTNIHEMIDDLLNMITEMLRVYADSNIKTVEIRYKQVPNMGNRVVFGVKKGLVILNEYINKVLKGSDSELRSNIMIFINKYNVVSPLTTKNCFYHSCLISLNNGTNDHKKYDHFISDHLDTREELTINNKCEEFSLFNSCGVDIIDGLNFIDDNTIFRYEPTLEKRAKILVFGAHAYALYPRNDKIDDELIRSPVYKEAEKIVTPKYADNNTNYKLMTWDLETCNTDLIDNKKTSTMVYASGCMYEKDDNDKPEWNITYNEEGKKIKTKIEKPKKGGIVLTKSGKTKYVESNYVYHEIYFNDVYIRVLIAFIISQLVMSVSNSMNQHIVYNMLCYNIYTFARDDGCVIDSFIHYLQIVPHKNLIIYAHNGGKFDTWFLIDRIVRTNIFYIRDILVQNGRIMNLHLVDKFNTRNILIRDSYTFITSSLNDACKDFEPDVKKLVDTVDHDKINYTNCHTDDIYKYTSQYLKNDVVSLFLILTDFDRLINASYGFSIKNVLTNASIARRLYLTKYNDKYEMYTCSEKHDKLIRSGYYGGRNECFTKMGVVEDKKLYYLDFTSLYPTCMKLYKYGYGELKDKPIDKFDKKLFGFYVVSVRHTKETIKQGSILPLHGVLNDGKLEFPYISEWCDMVLSSEEIKFSIDNNCGYEYQYKQVMYYEKNGYIFKDIIDHLYKMKLDAEKVKNEALRSIAKVIINSLYGFWGINTNDREQFTIKMNKSPLKNQAQINQYLYTNSLLDEHTVDDYVFIKYKESIDVNTSNIGIASMVCSYARMKLYTVLKYIREHGSNVYYCDTDSIITDYNVYEDKQFQKDYMSDKGALGQLVNETKVDKGHYNKLISLGLKQYALINENLKDESKKWKVLKFKGININNKYMSKEVDDTKKTITYSDLSKEGKYAVDIDDYEKLTKGYNLVCDNMTFLANTSVLLKDKPIFKLENNKVLKMNYSKANVNKDGEVSTKSLVVKNSVKKVKKQTMNDLHNMFTY